MHCQHTLMDSERTARRIDGLAAARALFAGLTGATVEIAGIAYLAADHRLLGVRFIRGDVDSVTIAPRILTIDALTFGAAGVIVAHNHPSGDARPSGHDLAHTRRVARALGGIEVRLLDHLVLGDGRVTSLRALGML